jgi:hypothetical protein
VARGAGQPRIAFRLQPAFAVFQTIRLESHVHYVLRSWGTGQNHVGPCAMARPAEIHRSHRVEPAWIEDGPPPSFDFSRFHGCDMLGTRSVARLALDAGCQMRRIQLAADIRPRSVATEAPAHFSCIHPSAHRGLEIIRIVPVPCREVKTLQRFVETQLALVELALVFIDVRLPLVAYPERPTDRGRKRIGAVSDRKVHRFAIRRKLVVIAG